MKKTNQRISTQIHTRKLDRQVARNQMHEKGMVRICKRDDTRKNEPSEFSKRWRDFKNYGTGTLI